ncbi:MAG: hypothetical protein JWO96_446 [Candidatus Saccharibacteria bacterium]|nr:hypothetical protein [Candidatus Saccharibacteria bacterium]
MHIYFSGIGGSAISALAVIAKEAGYEVSGSDARNSQYLDYLRKKGIEDIHVGLSRDQIAEVHARNPIDWYVYGSAQAFDFPDNEEFAFCREMGIKSTKRDELINEILSQKHLKLVAIAGTHGKTTTTAMAIWLFKQLGIPISYSGGAKISFGDMSRYEAGSDYFIYEADEFDRNFLAFHPFYSIIAGVAYDHHEIFPTQDDYNQAFRDFLAQSQRAILWEEDVSRLSLDKSDEKFTVESYEDSGIRNIKLAGLYNRRDAWLVIKAASQITGARVEDLFELMNRFPGVSRRFEKIIDNLYSDSAHTPEKITGAMNVAREAVGQSGQKLIVIYEPLTNRRMHHTHEQHRAVFAGADQIYWVPSFLAREDPSLPILTPEQLIKDLEPGLQRVARPARRDDNLKQIIQEHLKNGDLVLAMSGGGGDSLDDWLRKEFQA